jgi:hypothetical protein
MKTEKQIREKLNKLISAYFSGKLMNSEKTEHEHRIRELVWILDEVIFLDKEKVEIGGKNKCQKIKKS